MKISQRTGANLGWLAGLPQKDSNLQPADEANWDDITLSRTAAKRGGLYCLPRRAA